MTTLAEARGLALALPGTTEEPHHEISSFRVGKKIFATVPDDEHLNVMLGPVAVDFALGNGPDACAELWWGKRLAGVRVTLAAADPRLLELLLREAWRLKAPRRLHALLDGD